MEGFLFLRCLQKRLDKMFHSIVLKFSKIKKSTHQKTDEATWCFGQMDGWISVIDEMQKSPIEKRKRNLKTISPHSRGEREI